MHHPEREQTAPQLRPAAENTLEGEKARQPRARMQRAQPCERTNLEDIMDEVGAYRTMVAGRPSSPSRSRPPDSHGRYREIRTVQKGSIDWEHPLLWVFVL